VRGAVASLTLGCLLAVVVAAPAQAARPPKFELLGDWSFHGDKYRFSGHGRLLSGRSLTSVRIGHCLVRRGTVVFSRYRFEATHGGVDYWKGRVALVGGSGCKRRLVASTITLNSDLRFTESSRLPGGRRPPPSTFRRIRPPLSSSDPVLATWTRNGAGVVVTREGPLYVGRAREAFKIANGCIVNAGTVVWRMRPLAPDAYSGTIQTFLAFPGCSAGGLDATTWRFGSDRSQLIRISASGQSFAYTRA
jgi:hypothetical protein